MSLSLLVYEYRKKCDNTLHYSKSSVLDMKEIFSKGSFLTLALNRSGQLVVAWKQMSYLHFQSLISYNVVKHY